VRSLPLVALGLLSFPSIVQNHRYFAAWQTSSALPRPKRRDVLVDHPLESQGVGSDGITIEIRHAEMRRVPCIYADTE
jgi:hypothetical protein